MMCDSVTLVPGIFSFMGAEKLTSMKLKLGARSPMCMAIRILIRNKAWSEGVMKKVHDNVHGVWHGIILHK
jgi:hypothetical protein